MKSNTYKIYGYKCTMVRNIGFENVMTSDTIELESNKLKLRKVRIKYNATYGQSL